MDRPLQAGFLSGSCFGVENIAAGRPVQGFLGGAEGGGSGGGITGRNGFADRLNGGLVGAAPAIIDSSTTLAVSVSFSGGLEIWHLFSE